MASLRINVGANIVGKFWSVLANFLFVPLYIRYLGLEEYSLISFALVLHSIVVILDGGLTLTLSREFALSRSINEKWQTFRTLENIYIYILLFILIVFGFSSNWIANSWLNLSKIDPSYASKCIRIVGFSCGFQMLSSFYIGGFTGQERLVEVNIFRIIYSVIRAGLVVIPLLMTKSIFVFFLWQFITDCFYVAFLRWKIIPKGLSGKIILFRIDTQELYRVMHFASGIFLISLVAAINTQLDKIVISKIFEVSQLGVYNIAMTFALGLISLTSPITTAFQPRFTKLISEKNDKKIKDIFFKSFLIVSLLILCVSCVLSFNSNSVIWVWTGNDDLSIRASIYLPILLIGASAISYQTIPYCIAIGNGNTKYNNILGIVSLVITIPGYILAGKYYGPKGVACIYAISQVLITPIYLYVIIKKYLTSLSFRMIMIKCILIPGLSIIVIVFLLSHLPLFNNRFIDFMRIGFIAICTFIFGFIYYNFFNQSTHEG